jgi:predicted RNase H-like nuclease
MESTPAADDIHYGVKKLKLGNWLEPSVPRFFSITEEDWVKRVMEPTLIEAVPKEVRSLFEVARGSILYGWFFYPLLTLASEQIYRVQEAAIRERCEQVGIPTATTKANGESRPIGFTALLGHLRKRGVLPEDEDDAWENVKDLRNRVSHPRYQPINVPSAAIVTVQVAARRINQLFTDNPSYHSFRGGRVRRNTGLDQNRDFPVVAGIDVGGERRGFHLVSLQGAAIKSTWATRDAADAAAWCIDQGAKLVGVDAPSGWSKGIAGEFKSREAERSIHSEGFHIFFTPTKEEGSKRAFSQWMLNGERLYAELVKHYPLYGGQSSAPPECCFETYPYIAACGLANKRMSAKNKNPERREIIRSAGIDPTLLRNQDYVDAGICALVAYSVHIDYCTAYGHENEGFILTPPLNYLA